MRAGGSYFLPIGSVSMKPKEWELWFANVIFEEDRLQSKTRPFIVMVTGAGFAVGLKVTSQGPRDNDYRLEYWSEAGLAKPSYVRLDKKVKIQESDLLHKLGRIHPIDQIKIEYRLAALVQ